MQTDVHSNAIARGVTRLCHFTRSESLPGIIERGAVLATAVLREEGLTFRANDPWRFDRHTTHISCTIQHPNSFCLNKMGDPRSEDWVVLLFDPEPLWADDTLFCPVNASKDCGAHIQEGVAGFERMFGSLPVMWGHRSQHHLVASPTDVQAEVLVRDCMPLHLVRGVVVRDKAQLVRERVRLANSQLSDLPFGVAACPEYFRSWSIANAIQRGQAIDPDFRAV